MKTLAILMIFGVTLSAQASNDQIKDDGLKKQIASLYFALAKASDAQAEVDKQTIMTLSYIDKNYFIDRNGAHASQADAIHLPSDVLKLLNFPTSTILLKKNPNNDRTH